MTQYFSLIITIITHITWRHTVVPQDLRAPIPQQDSTTTNLLTTYHLIYILTSTLHHLRTSTSTITYMDNTTDHRTKSTPLPPPPQQPRLPSLATVSSPCIQGMDNTMGAAPAPMA